MRLKTVGLVESLCKWSSRFYPTLYSEALKSTGLPRVAQHMCMHTHIHTVSNQLFNASVKYKQVMMEYYTFKKRFYCDGKKIETKNQHKEQEKYSIIRERR